MSLPYSTYQTLPSSFQLIEWPLYWLNTQYHAKDRYDSSSDRNNPYYTELNQTIASHYTAISSHYQNQEYAHICGKAFAVSMLYGKKCLPTATERKFIVTFLGSTAINPVILCLTPITLVADIALGLIEALWAKLYHKASSHQVELILRKKWMASPCQHLTFLGANSAVMLLLFAKPLLKIWFQSQSNPSTWIIKKIDKWVITKIANRASTTRLSAVWPFGRVATTVMVVSSIFAVPAYHITQKIVGNDLPDWARPEGFNIFINGGAPDKDGKLFTEKLETQYKNYQHNTHNRHSNVPNAARTSAENWEDFITKDVPNEASQIDDNHKLKPLLNQLQNKASREAFLNVTVPLSQEKLSSAYKRLAFTVHPDRNPNDTAVAEFLFKLICEARSSLEKEHGFGN